MAARNRFFPTNLLPASLRSSACLALAGTSSIASRSPSPVLHAETVVEDFPLPEICVSSEFFALQSPASNWRDEHFVRPFPSLPRKHEKKESLFVLLFSFSKTSQVVVSTFLLFLQLLTYI